MGEKKDKIQCRIVYISVLPVNLIIGGLLDRNGAARSASKYFLTLEMVTHVN